MSDTQHSRWSGVLARWRRICSERGASLVEYALLIALVAVVLFGAVTALGTSVDDSLDRSNTSIIDATT